MRKAIITTIGTALVLALLGAGCRRAATTPNDAGSPTPLSLEETLRVAPPPHAPPPDIQPTTPPPGTPAR
ncbi:MAG: hypothetical protein V1723_04100 [Candidatus Uhrbacteria bacterium]